MGSSPKLGFGWVRVPAHGFKSQSGVNSFNVYVDRSKYKSIYTIYICIYIYIYIYIYTLYTMYTILYIYIHTLYIYYIYIFVLFPLLKQNFACQIMFFFT